MAKRTKIEPPEYLGEIGREKWEELTAALAGKPFELDKLAMLCASWQTYRTALADVAENGIVYRDTKNGRVWNNPAVNAASVALKEVFKLAVSLGLWDAGASADAESMPPGLED